MDLGFHRPSSFMKKCLFLLANGTDITHFYVSYFVQDTTRMHSSGVVCFTVVVSDTADLLRKNTDQENYKEDVKVKVMLAVSCTTLICSFMFMLCCFIAFIKYKMKKG